MRFLLAALALCTSAGSALAAPETPPAAPKPKVEKVLIEIYRIAPGLHQAFLEEIARYDEANRRAGLPPRQLYIHSDGADWDFMFIQPARTPADKAAALDKAWDEMKLPSGADFFLQFRRFIAEHSDTFASGPTTAAEFLATRAKQ